MKQKSTRRGNTQDIVKKCHSRMFLSGMALNIVTTGNLTRCPSSSRNVGMRDIGAAPTLYPACLAARRVGVTERGARGFTLIELLVVVIIIAILAAIALPQYNKAVMKARATELQTFVAHVEKAMDLYVLENGYSSSGVQKVPWDEMGFDVSSYCDSVNPTYYTCTAKNFEATAPFIWPDGRWSFGISPSESALGPSTISIMAYKDGTKEKKCGLSSGSLKAKPMCDALKASDSSWEIYLPSGI